MTRTSLLLAVPNISEGRDDALVAYIAGNRYLLDIHSDVDHNRSVVTYAAEPDALVETCVQMLDRAIECLDIRTHTGVHPRFGVVDILPIVPYEESRAIAERVAHDIGSRADATLPVHFYDDSRPLPELRRELRAPHQQHPTAGVLCIGVRPPLIAFNVNVRTQLDAAKQIARGLRSMPGIRALAFELPSRGLVQISMNLIAPDQTGPKTAYERVAASGVRIVDAEVVGLVPQTVAHELSDVPLRVPFRTIEEALNRT